MTIVLYFVIKDPEKETHDFWKTHSISSQTYAQGQLHVPRSFAGAARIEAPPDTTPESPWMRGNYIVGKTTPEYQGCEVCMGTRPGMGFEHRLVIMTCGLLIRHLFLPCCTVRAGGFRHERPMGKLPGDAHRLMGGSLHYCSQNG